MPFYLKKQIGTHNTGILGIWEITESVAELQVLLVDKLAHSIPMDYLSFKNSQRQKEWLVIRVLLSDLLPPKTFARIVYDDYGKPYLANRLYQIGISHTKNYGLILLHPTASVGVDVEAFHPKVQKIKHKFLSSQEQAQIPDGVWQYLTLYWSAKESLYKWYGKKELDFIHHLHILRNEISTEDLFKGVLYCRIVKGDFKQDLKVFYTSFDGHVLTWVTNK